MSELPDFGMTVTASEGDVTVHLAGDFDLATVPTFLDKSAAIPAGDQHVTVELSELAFIDSSGLAALVKAVVRVGERGGDLVFKAPTPATLRVLEITGLVNVLQIVP